jgi:hypothetical protein
MVAGMDRNTMIVRVVEALLWFAALVVVVLRLDRLWLRLRELQLHLGEAVKISARFFQPERRTDRLIVTHPDDDHQFVIVPHHGRRSLQG